MTPKTPNLFIWTDAEQRDIEQGLEGLGYL